MADQSTLRVRVLLRSPWVLLLALAPLWVPACDEDETAGRSMATCPNELPASGEPCSASQHGLLCTYIYVNDVAHCEARYEAECRGAASSPAWVVESNGCTGGGGAGGGAGAGGSSSSSTSGSGGGGGQGGGGAGGATGGTGGAMGGSGGWGGAGGW